MQYNGLCHTGISLFKRWSSVIYFSCFAYRMLTSEHRQLLIQILNSVLYAL